MVEGRRVEVYKSEIKDGKMILSHDYYGIFLSIGIDSKEFQNGVGTFSVAVVQNFENGWVSLVPFHLLKFQG